MHCNYQPRFSRREQTSSFQLDILGNTCNPPHFDHHRLDCIGQNYMYILHNLLYWPGYILICKTPQHSLGSLGNYQEIQYQYTLLRIGQLDNPLYISRIQNF